MGALLIILAVAAFFRFAHLDSVPPGMTHDEAAFGAEAEQVLAGERPLYFALGYGHEPAYAYLSALAFSLLGRSLIALRTTSAVCGLLVVLGTYPIARRMYGARAGLLSAGWMAVAFWPLSLSRQALRAITLPMLWLPAVWFFWRGIQASGLTSQGLGLQPIASNPGARATSSKPSIPSFALSGLFLGATVYTYMASRVTWLAFPLFALYLVLLKRTRPLLKRVWPGMLVLVATAGIVALPLGLYLRAHPASEVRFGLMMEPLRELLAGNPERVLRHGWNALRVFSWVGDRFWAYNIPGRPVFNWLGSVLFYAGLLLALWRWRDPRYGFTLIWLVVGMAPALVTTNEGIFLRAIVAQPATYILTALPVVSGWRASVGLLRGRGSRRWACAAWVAVALAVLFVEGVRTFRDYFVDWPHRPEARNIYNHTLVSAAKYLRDDPQGGAVGISALYPLYYHDPWILRYVAGRDDLQARWFEGSDRVSSRGGGIVYPGQGEARYVFTALTPLDAALRPAFERHAQQIGRWQLDPADQNPYFEVWHWDGDEALAANMNALQANSPMWISPETQFSEPALRRPVQSPVSFGDLMALIGYQLHGEPIRPDLAVPAGGTVELISYWRALRTAEAEDDWVTFVHLLDRNSQTLGGVDVLHCPPTGWRPGDVAVQVHRFQVAADAPQGEEAYLEIGVYRRSTGRLPVLIDGQARADRLLLVPVRIEPS
jgi:4-amino-4-deoxy-L-arabinose transferase-like glycosyltransferase